MPPSDEIVLSGHALAFAARGFAQSLTDEQRATFLSLFGMPGEAAMSAIAEQCEFERGSAPPDLPFPAVMAALDYALPRSSAAGSIVADEITRKWDSLSEMTKREIRRRIHRAVEVGRAGMTADVRIWMTLANLPINAEEQADRLRF